MLGFLSFRTMIAPRIIEGIFFAGCACSVVAGVFFGGMPVLGAMLSGDVGAVVSAGVFGAILFIGFAVVIPFFLRLYCELAILFFRMNETLVEIADKLGAKRQLPAEPKLPRVVAPKEAAWE